MLTVENLEASYGAIRALHGISIHVAEGEAVALLGVNGVGKSTTLESIMGVLRPVKGTITFSGDEITSKSPGSIVRRGISLVPEGRDIFGALTVEENLRLGAYVGYKRDRYLADLDEMFELFSILKERFHQAGGLLSGGEQQMLAIAVAYYFREWGLGLKLRATRDDRHAAAAIGINMINVRYLGFILSALVAGVSGGLWALYITSFSPKAFYMAEMFMLLAMLVIGGAGSVSGATTGAVVVPVARELLRQTESTINNAHVLPFEVYGLAQLVMAVLLVVVLIWRPSGVIGGQELRWPLFKRKDRAEDAAEQKLAA